MDLSAVALALLVALLWGSQPVFHKFFLKDISIKWIVIISAITNLACVLFFATYFRNDLAHESKSLSKKVVFQIALFAITTIFVANLVYLFVLKSNKSYLVSALIYCAPIFTLLLAYMLRSETITLVPLIGVLLVLAGVLAIALGSRSREKNIKWL